MHGHLESTLLDQLAGLLAVEPQLAVCRILSFLGLLEDGFKDGVAKGTQLRGRGRSVVDSIRG